MQLTSFTDYSLRVLIFLAVQKRSSISVIAKTYGISRNHIVKVVHNLSKIGYVKTVQGRGGGISLAMSAEKINLKNLVVQTENFYIVECFQPQGKCKITNVCKLQNILYEAKNSFLDTLEKYSLQDIVNNENEIKQAFK
ncbi:Rrf2 family transcriptional regulator [Candidatus Uabimicrobium sp. HlEnr_7]|uniref:Rrf2 family transcriptional regulator n=1 Tax=Candidatus Uabimicrobium helgolandensis TaxID=3095367 RepID=UPI003558B57D